MENLKKFGHILIRLLVLVLMFFLSIFIFEKIKALDSFIDLTGNLFLCLPVFLTYFIFKDYKRYDLRLKDKKALKNFAFGSLIGILSMTLVFIGDVLLKRIEVVGIQNAFASQGFYKYLILMLGVGIGEEMLSRGYMQNMVSHFSNRYLGILLPGLVFAALHFFNPGALANPLPAINLFLVSIVFALLTLYKSLWAAIGYHFTWNFFQGGVFAMSVSGTGQAANTLFVINVINDDLIYGGDFGPEGGLLVTGVLLAAIIFLYFKYGKDKEIK